MLWFGPRRRGEGLDCDPASMSLWRRVFQMTAPGASCADGVGHTGTSGVGALWADFQEPGAKMVNGGDMARESNRLARRRAGKRDGAAPGHSRLRRSYFGVSPAYPSHLSLGRRHIFPPEIELIWFLLLSRPPPGGVIDKRVLGWHSSLQGRRRARPFPRKEPMPAWQRASRRIVRRGARSAACARPEV